jgi:hypothetical protein
VCASTGPHTRKGSCTFTFLPFPSRPFPYATVSFVPLLSAHHYVKYGDLYKTLDWKKWLGVTAVATPALVNVAATSPVLNKAPLGSTLGNGTPLKYTVVYLYLPCCKASL